MDSRPLGERIRAARLERKMTQDELARDTFSKSYVSAVELGKIQPSIKALRILARRLQLPASYFLETLEPDMETQQARLVLSRIRLLLHHGERYQEALNLLKGLDRERVDDAENAEITYLEGLALAGLEQFEEALVWLQQARTEWEELDEPNWLERVRNCIGEIYFRQRKYIQAQEQYKAGLQAIEQNLVHDPALQLSIYTNLAQVYSTLDMHDAARGLFEAAHNLAGRVATTEGLIGSLLDIGASYETQKNLSAALQVLELAQGVLYTTEIARQVTNLHLVFGQVFLVGHNWAEAEKCFQMVLASTASSQANAIRIAAYNQLANLFLRQERLKEAEIAAEQALQALQNKPPDGTTNKALLATNPFSNPDLANGEVLLSLARISEKKGERQQTDGYFEKAIASLKLSGQAEPLSAAYFAYGEVLLERGDSAQGANFLKIAYEVKTRGSVSI